MSRIVSRKSSFVIAAVLILNRWSRSEAVAVTVLMLAGG